jgi:hypothetical protein
MVRPFDRLMVLSEVEAQAHHKWKEQSSMVSYKIATSLLSTGNHKFLAHHKGLV